jgi:hypothetical protein
MVPKTIRGIKGSERPKNALVKAVLNFLSKSLHFQNERWRGFWLLRKKLSFSMIRHGLLAVILLLSVMARPADSFFGFSAGLSFSFGNKVNRLGISVAAYYTYGFAQVNSGVKAYYNFQSLGLKRKTPELQLALGTELGFGKKDPARNNFIGITENNLLYMNSIGYTYLVYLDKNQTSQTAGALALNIRDFKIVAENDLFGAGQGWRDRFRTGAFLLEYQYLDTKFAINSTFWTGDYTGCDNIYDSDYPARFGYRSCEKGRYCDYSLGLLSVQVSHLLPLPLGQVAHLSIGIDSERVRHALQNNLIHDQPFFPEKWIKRKPAHLPMLNCDNGQYLFSEEDTVKPPTFYFNLGMNNNPFY